MKPSSTWVLLATAVLVAFAPTVSDAKPQATCKAMCQRLTDCKLASYTKMCLDTCKQYGYEASEEGRAQLLVLTRYTCKQIQSAVGATGAAQPQPPSRPSGSPRSSSARSAAPPAPSPRYDTDDADDADDEHDDDGRPAAAGSDRGRRSYRATSDSDPGDTSCSWVCRRLSECNLMAYQRCGEMCANAASSDHPLRIGRESCAEIKKAFVTSKWTCWAEGSTGVSYGDGPYTYGAKSVPANGRTRDEAAHQALRDCGSLVSLDANLNTLSGARTDNGSCRVTRCFPPGTPLR